MAMYRNFLLRLFSVILIVSLAAGLIYFAFLETMPDLIPLLQHGKAADIEAYLQSSNKIKGLLCTALLQVVQVFSVVLPGAPIQIAAGIVYGTWRSFLVCHTASVAANVVSFLTVRHLGARMNRLMPVNIQSARLDFIRNSTHPSYMAGVACLIPILPIGFIPYVAAQTRTTAPKFALAMYLGNLLPIFVSCAAGSKVLEGNYTVSAILLVVLFLLAFLLAKYKGRVLDFVEKITGSKP